MKFDAAYSAAAKLKAIPDATWLWVEALRLRGANSRQAYLHGQNRSVPRASIVWLARAVNVVRPATLRLHIDRARFAKGGRLGNTLGIRTTTGLRITNQSKDCCLAGKSAPYP